MKFNSSGQLRIDLYHEIVEIHREVAAIRRKRSVPKSKDKEKMDYPAMVIGCEYNRHRSVGRSSGGNTGHKRKSLQPKLENKLIEVGRNLTNHTINPPETYKHTNGETLFFGTCAEDDAADILIQKYTCTHPYFPKLNNITFTKPIRPRTGSKKQCCRVCKKVFS